MAWLTADADQARFLIPATGLVIGRDPSCDLVLTSGNVSRRHATIMPGPDGYSIRDASMNGVLVNGERASRSQLLAPGDVIRIGDTTFCFSPEMGRGAAMPDSPALDASFRPSVVRPDSSPATAPMPRQMPGRGAELLLATLEVCEGPLPEGMRFPIERPVAQLGRGAACDVCLVDESVSGAHATLMFRDGRWHLIDHASFNGTYVDGQRIEHCELTGACEIRLGAVTLRFQPAIPPNCTHSRLT